MFGFTSLNELLILMLVIAVLSITGLWPRIIQGLRQLRGDEPPPGDTAQPGPSDIDLSCQMLGVSPSAPWEEIERAYRRKAKIHHPDHGGDEDTMRALNRAYAQLKQVRGPGKRGVRH